MTTGTLSSFKTDTVSADLRPDKPAVSLGRVDISDYVILSDHRERRISCFDLNLHLFPEIPRHSAPRNDILGQMSTEPSLEKPNVCQSTLKCYRTLAELASRTAEGGRSDLGGLE